MNTDYQSLEYLRYASKLPFIPVGHIKDEGWKRDGETSVSLTSGFRDRSGSTKKQRNGGTRTYDHGARRRKRIPAR